jgi:endo-1,4-beta-xylanase
MCNPMNLVLGAAAGIISLMVMGCGGSGSGLAPGSAAGASVGGTGGGVTGGVPTGGSSLGGAGAGATGVSTAAGASDVGGKTGGAVSTIGTPSSTGAGGNGGTLSTGTGSRGGGSTLATGGTSGTGGTSAQGGASVAVTSSGGAATGGTTTSAGSLGGTSSSGGTTSVGTRSGPVFPPRFVGNIDTHSKVLPDFSKYWDQFTPENAGKWSTVQWSGGQYVFRWDTLDAMYAYTQEHNIIFKEMCFIWGDESAGWLTSKNVGEAAPAWMQAFCDRYPNTRLIDVVNEPTHMTPAFAEGLGGGGQKTFEWVANAFKMAREACPNAVLILNDYNICEYGPDHQKFLDMMAALKRLNAPIDAIGCEAHDAAKVTVSKFKGYLDALASQTGLPIYITEFDVDLADGEQQRKQYADYFTMFWDNPNVKGMTVWGYITGQTWRSNTGIMSSDGTMRPAMSWLMDFLKR